MASRSIALFPLPLVLFPGAVQPLHIFEPRYRQMLSDCLARDREFGVICTRGDVESQIEAGRMGCVAHVESTEELGDGRSNIIVIGTERFVFRELVDRGTPYLVAAVELVGEPEIEPSSLEAISESVRRAFTQVGEAARMMQDDLSPLPQLPNDASQLSFAIAQFMDLELEDQQRLLSTVGAEERLRHLESILSTLATDLEERARVHRSARHNGRGYGDIAPHA